MTSKLWHISTEAFAAAVKEIDTAPSFELDETVHTWCASFFRFVHSPIDSFPDIIRFAAAAIYSTPMPLRSVVQWSNDVAIFPVDNDRVMDTLITAREDCVDKLSECNGIPDWLSFDGDVIHAFDIDDRGGQLVAIASHHVYRTSRSYYYICINRES